MTKSYAAAVRAATKDLPDDLHALSEHLRAIEGLADRMDEAVEFHNVGFEGSNAMNTLAIALRALTHRAGGIVELQQRRRGLDYRGWLTELENAA